MIHITSANFHEHAIVTTLAKRGNYLLGKSRLCFGSVGLSVSLIICGQHYSKRYDWIMLKFCGGFLGGAVKN